MPRAAVVLAGGALSGPRRGGGWEGEALAAVEGKPMVARVVESALELVDFVFVVTKRGEKSPLTKLLQPALAEDADLVKVIEDAPRAGGGPLSGVNAALKKCFTTKKFRAETCIILPCDMPFLKPEVIEVFIRGVREGDVSLLVWSSGAIEPLPMGAKVDKVYMASEGLCRAGRRKLTDIARAVESVRYVHVESEIAAVDPDLMSLINVNRPEDLEALRPRVPKSSHVAVKGSFTFKNAKIPLSLAANVSVRNEEEAESSYVMLSASPFWRGVLGEQYGRVAHDVNAIAEAASSFEEEAEMYERAGLLSLAAHALLDAARCRRAIDEFERAEALASEARSLFERAGL